MAGHQVISCLVALPLAFNVKRYGFYNFDFDVELHGYVAFHVVL